MNDQEREDFDGALWLANRAQFAQAYPILRQLYEKFPDNLEVKNAFERLYSVYRPPEYQQNQPQFANVSSDNNLRKRQKWAFIIVGVLVLVAIVTSVTAAIIAKAPATSNPTANINSNKDTNLTPTPSIGVYGFGETGTIGKWEISVTNAIKIGSQLTWSNVGNKTNASGVWLLVYVKITNNGRATDKLGFDSFGIRDSEGNLYTADFDSNVYSEFEGYNEITKNIPPGVTSASILAFDVKQSIEEPNLLFVLDENNGAVFNLGKVH